MFNVSDGCLNGRNNTRLVVRSPKTLPHIDTKMLFTILQLLYVTAYPQQTIPSTPGSFQLREWLRPSESADRSPCPGLNTLANHGYLNHNGRNISDNDIRGAFKEVYGIAEGASNRLISSIGSAKSATGTLDLNNLRKHNLIGTDF
jgi:Peroxidase, family 2